MPPWIDFINFLHNYTSYNMFHICFRVKSINLIYQDQMNIDYMISNSNKLLKFGFTVLLSSIWYHFTVYALHKTASI